MGEEIDQRNIVRSAILANFSVPGKIARNLKKEIYFPELDGLRFFAFFLVFVYHYSLLTQVYFNSPLKYFWIGVDLFFVLSAFLFTKLLTAEYSNTRSISFKKFYLRRIFRIWPIYFLFVGFSTAYYILKNGPLSKSIGLRVLGLFSFSDNLITAVKGYSPLPFTGHLWTIGYEEQFYIFVPIIIYFLVRSSVRTRLIFFGSVLVLFNMIRFVLISDKATGPAIYVLPFTHFESILMGIIVGFGDTDFLFEKLRPLVLGLFGVLFFGFLCLLPVMEDVSFLLIASYSFVGLSTSSVLFSVSNSDLLRKIFSNKLLVFLGKRSYGLYVYHLLAYAIANAEVRRIQEVHVKYFALFGVWLFITVVISLASYEFIELPFLRLKKRFEVVRSRPI